MIRAVAVDILAITIRNSRDVMKEARQTTNIRLEISVKVNGAQFVLVLNEAQAATRKIHTNIFKWQYDTIGEMIVNGMSQRDQSMFTFSQKEGNRGVKNQLLLNHVRDEELFRSLPGGVQGKECGGGLGFLRKSD